MDLSTIQIIGRLGADPEIRYTPNETRVASFRLAVNRRRGEVESTTWYSCSAFGRLADTIDNLVYQGAMIKGKRVCVTGDLDPREYQARDGAMKLSLDINCNNVILIDPREAAAAPAQPGGYGGNAVADDVPF